VLYQLATTDQDWAHDRQVHVFSVAGGDPTNLYTVFTAAEVDPREGWLFFSRCGGVGCGLLTLRGSWLSRSTHTRRVYGCG
jgi:hypothetical protein